MDRCPLTSPSLQRCGVTMCKDHQEVARSALVNGIIIISMMNHPSILGQHVHSLSGYNMVLLTVFWCLILTFLMKG
jgi:hypothetical protein